jgi:amidase
MSALASGHELNTDMLTFTAPFNMSGNPTVTLPGGMTKADVPIGFQLVGDHFSEGLLHAVAHAYQLATRWHTRHPSLGR